MAKAPIQIISVYCGRMGEAFSLPGTGTSRMRLLRTIAGRLGRWKTALSRVDTANPRVEVQRMGVPAPPPRLTVRGRCELSRTDGRPSCNDAPPFVVLWGDVIARQPTGQVPPECLRV